MKLILKKSNFTNKHIFFFKLQQNIFNLEMNEICELFLKAFSINFQRIVTSSIIYNMKAYMKRYILAPLIAYSYRFKGAYHATTHTVSFHIDHSEARFTQSQQYRCTVFSILIRKMVILSIFMKMLRIFHSLISPHQPIKNSTTVVKHST